MLGAMYFISFKIIFINFESCPCNIGFTEVLQTHCAVLQAAFDSVNLSVAQTLLLNLITQSIPTSLVSHS